MIFYEFIYFYMHMTMRYASSVMNEEQMKKLQEYLGPVIVSTSIDSFIMHWPQELKEKITDDFYDCLNDADIEYATAKEIISKDDPFKENTLCYKLGVRVSEWIGNSLNPSSIFEVTMMATDELIKMKLNNLVTEAANTL